MKFRSTIPFATAVLSLGLITGTQGSAQAQLTTAAVYINAAAVYTDIGKAVIIGKGNVTANAYHTNGVPGGSLKMSLPNMWAFSGTVQSLLVMPNSEDGSVRISVKAIGTGYDNLRRPFMATMEVVWNKPQSGAVSQSTTLATWAKVPVIKQVTIGSLASGSFTYRL